MTPTHFLGMKLRETDAIYDDHIMATPQYLFYGRRAFFTLLMSLPSDNYYNPKNYDHILCAVETSRYKRRSVPLAMSRPA